MELIKRDKIITSIAIGLFPTLILTACQSGYRNHSEKVTESYRNGDYVLSATMASQGAEENSNSKKNRVVYNLEAARTCPVAGDYTESKRYYDLVHEDVRPYLDSEAEAKITEAFATTAVNQTLSIYRATPAERIMCNALNAINCIKMGDFQLARIELRRAGDWQEYAKTKYMDEIEEAQRSAKEKSDKEGLGHVASGDGIPPEMKSNYSNLEDLSGYGDFQNPFVSHFRGIYLMSRATSGDDSNARWELKRTLEMNPDCRAAIEPDLQLLEGSATSALPPTTWVYFMTGEAPHLSELRLDIPIPVGNINYIGAAFPQLEMNENFDAMFEIETSNYLTKTRTPSYLLVDMDSVVASEFSVRLPTIIAQEIASTAIKAIATKVAADKNPILGVVGIIGQAASTSADLRSWRTLPKHIYVCRIPTPKDGVLSMFIGGSDFGNIQVVSEEDNVVVVTLPSSSAAFPSVMSAQLSGESK